MIHQYKWLGLGGNEFFDWNEVLAIIKTKNNNVFEYNNEFYSFEIGYAISDDNYNMYAWFWSLVIDQKHTSSGCVHTFQFYITTHVQKR